MIRQQFERKTHLCIKVQKQKLISIFLFLVLLMPAVCLYSWFQMEQSSIKRTVKWKIATGIDKSELVTIKLSKADAEKELKWKHAKEFQFKGEMYDIVERKAEGDTLTFYCWWDFEETKLNKKVWALTHRIFNQSQEKQEKEQQLLKVFKSLYCQEHALMNFKETAYQSIKTFFYHAVLVDRYTKPNTPPPKLCYLFLAELISS